MFNRFVIAAAMSALLSACGGGSSDKPLSDTQKNFEASALGSTYSEFDWELPSTNAAPVTGSNFFLASTYSVAASPSSGAIAYTRATLNLTQSMALPDASTRYVARALFAGKIYVLNNATKSVVSYSGNDVVVTDYASDGVTPVFSSVFDLWSEPVALSGITLNDAALRSFYGFARLNTPLNFDYTKTWLAGAAYVKRKTYTADDRLYVYDWSGNSVDANVVAYAGTETGNVPITVERCRVTAPLT